MRGPTLPLLFAISGAAAVLAPALAEAAPTRQACVSAYEETQTAMRRSRLLAARAALQTCLDEACPSVLRSDCAGWLKEVEARTPSVVVECSADGALVRDVRLFVDGTLHEGGSDGKAMDVDPGTHSFRVEPPGSAPVSAEVLVREGEKLKVVRLELPGTRDKVAKDPTPGSEKDGGRPPVPSGGQRPVPWPVYASAGIGIAAAAGFAVFALSGTAGKKDLEPCKPDCSASQISDVRKQFITADVFLGLSVIALGTAGYLFFTRPTVPTSAGQPTADALSRFLTSRALAF
jgi:hypothetical protein